MVHNEVHAFVCSLNPSGCPFHTTATACGHVKAHEALLQNGKPPFVTISAFFFSAFTPVSEKPLTALVHKE